MANLKNDINGPDNLNKSYVWINLSSLLIALLIVLADLIFFRFLPPKMPLFYSLSWGNQQLATHQQFLVLPLSIILISLLNLSISWQLHPSQSFFKKILLISPLIISLILIITFIKIILIFI